MKQVRNLPDSVITSTCHSGEVQNVVRHQRATARCPSADHSGETRPHTHGWEPCRSDSRKSETSRHPERGRLDIRTKTCPTVCLRSTSCPSSLLIQTRRLRQVATDDGEPSAAMRICISKLWLPLKERRPSELLSPETRRGSAVSDSSPVSPRGHHPPLRRGPRASGHVVKLSQIKQTCSVARCCRQRSQWEFQRDSAGPRTGWSPAVPKP